jgi:hypothetical protein
MMAWRTPWPEVRPQPRHAVASGAAQGWGLAAFLLLFPGFFFYHTLLGLGLIPALLGGYFTPVALLLALPLWRQLRRQLRTGSIRLFTLERMYLVYLAFLTLVVLLNGAAGQGRHTLVNHLLCVLFMAELYAIFRLTDFSTPLARRLGWMSLAAMSAIVFSYAVDGVFYLAPMGQAVSPDSLATYQGFSRSYALVLAVVVATLHARWLRLLWYGLGSATLFLNTARSEFATALLLLPLIELHRARHRLRTALLLLAGLGALAACLPTLITLLPENRILELLDLSHSTSASKRQQLADLAWQTVQAHPLLGEFGSYPPGLYAHNILSAWVDTGLFGFIFLLALLAAALLGSLRLGLFGPPGWRRANALALAATTVVLALTAHFFTDMLIGATIGAYACCRQAIEEESRDDPHRSPDLGTPTLGRPHPC